MIFHINIESNPGSVGRLGAGLIHASLFKLLKFNGIKVQIVKEPTLLFEKSQLSSNFSKISKIRVDSTIKRTEKKEMKMEEKE